MSAAWCIIIELHLIGAPFDILWGYAMRKKTAPITFVASDLNQAPQVCAFCKAANQEHPVLFSFIGDEFQRGSEAIYFIDPDQFQDRARKKFRLRIRINRAGSETAPA